LGNKWGSGRARGKNRELGGTRLTSEIRSNTGRVKFVNKRKAAGKKKFGLGEKRKRLGETFGSKLNYGKTANEEKLVVAGSRPEGKNKQGTAAESAERGGRF